MNVKLTLLAALNLSVAFAFCGCVQINRHPRSGYEAESAGPTSVPQRSGEKSQISKSTKLKQLENRLSSKKEIEQYSKALPWFEDENEKMAFLEIPDFEGRMEWLQENDFAKRPQQKQNEMRELVEAQDIAIGMPQSFVRKSWGEPERIDVSGHPSFKNERWRYSKFISSPDGFKPEKKTVYFEGGKVVGWDVE